MAFESFLKDPYKRSSESFLGNPKVQPQKNPVHEEDFGEPIVPLEHEVDDRYTKEIQGYVNKYANMYGEDPELIRRIIGQESSFNPKAVSKKGARSLMQVMPETWKELGIAGDPFHPENSIHGGVKYLSWLRKQFKNDRDVLAAYNAGPGRFKAGKAFENQETRDYVKRILQGYTPPRKAEAVTPKIEITPEGKKFIATLPPGMQRYVTDQLLQGREAKDVFKEFEGIEANPLLDPTSMVSFGAGFAATKGGSLLTKAGLKAAGANLTSRVLPKEIAKMAAFDSALEGAEDVVPGSANVITLATLGLLGAKPLFKGSSKLYKTAMNVLKEPVRLAGNIGDFMFNDILKSQAGKFNPNIGQVIREYEKRAGDWAWNTVGPLYKKALSLPLFPERFQRLEQYLGGRSMSEFIYPATERMQRDPARSFTKTHVGKSIASQMVDDEVVPFMKSLDPAQRTAITRWINLEKKPQTVDEMRQMFGGHTDVIKQWEEISSRLTSEPQKLNAYYQDLMDVEFRKRLQGVFGKMTDATLASVQSKLDQMPDSKRIKLPWMSREKFDFKKSQDVFRALIRTPGLTTEERQAAINLHDMVANSPRQILQAYNNATVELLADKVSRSPWSSKLPRAGFVKGTGPLKDLYIPKEIQQGFDELNYMRSKGNDVVQKYFTTPWKILRVVMRMPTQFRNVFGNMVLNDMMGSNPLPWYTPEGVAMYTKAIARLRGGHPSVAKFKKLTGVDATTFIGADAVKGFTPGRYDDTVLDSVLRGFHWISKPWAKMYQWNESFSKYAKFLWNKEHGMGDAEAALDAVRATFDYSDVSIATRRMRENMMPFFTWKAKIFGQFPEAVVRHPIRVAKYAAIPAYITNHALEKLDMTPEEYEEYKKKMPDFLQNGWLMPLPWRDDKDKIQFMDLTFMIPGLADMYELWNGVTGGAKSDWANHPGRSAAGVIMGSQNLVQNPVVRLLADFLTGTNSSTGAPLWIEGENRPDIKLSRWTTYVAKQLTPGFFGIPGTPIVGNDLETIARTLSGEDPEALTGKQVALGQFGVKLIPAQEEQWERIYRAKMMETERRLKGELRTKTRKGLGWFGGDMGELMEDYQRRMLENRGYGEEGEE